MGNIPTWARITIIAVIIIVIIVVIVILFRRSSANTATANTKAIQEASCPISLYSSQGPPIVCDFTTGQEVRKRTGTNVNCPTTKQFPNANCNCANICKATKTCSGATSTTVYTTASGKPCNASCMSMPLIVQDDPTCNVTGCDLNCSTSFEGCDPFNPGKQLVSVSQASGGGTCDAKCIVPNISNPLCVGSGCSQFCNTAHNEIISQDPNTGASICIPKPSGFPACNLPFIQSLSNAPPQIPVKLTTYARGQLNPPQFLARVNNDQGATYQNCSVIFAPETVSADNLWILYVDEPSGAQNKIHLASDPSLILAYNGNLGIVTLSFQADIGGQGQFAAYPGDGIVPGVGGGASIVLGGAYITSFFSSNDLSGWPGGNYNSNVTQPDKLWYTVTPGVEP